MKYKSIITAIIILMLAIGGFADVTTTHNKNQFSCNGSTTEFAFTFDVIGGDTSDIVVILRDSDGNATTLLENSHYTVSATNNDYRAGPGGTVTTTTAYASGYTLTVYRSEDIDQDTVQSGFAQTSAIANSIDELKFNIQDIYEWLGRCLYIPISDTSHATELPTSENRVEGYLYSDPNSEITVVTGVTPDDVVVSGWGETLIDDANAAMGRGTLGLDTDDDVEFADLIVSGPRIDVRAYDAFPGAGDVSTEFEAAIDAAISADIPLYVSSGTYDLTGMSKSITGALTIIGNGMETTILDSATKISTTASITVKNITILDWSSGIDIDSSGGNVSGLYFDHVRFKGSGATEAAGINEAGTANTISDVRITNCEFDTLYSAGSCVGVRLSPICLDVIISNNLFKDMDGLACMAIQIGSGGAPEAGTSRINITGNVFRDISADDAEECHAVILYGNHCVISNNNIDTITGTSTGKEAIYTKGYRNAIVGNMIKDGGVNEAYIAVKGGDDSYDNIIANNILTGTNANQAILVHGGATISGNVIKLVTTGQGIKCHGNVEGSSVDYRYSIIGNKISCPEDGLIITDCKNTVVQGNVIVSADEDAIILSKDNEATYAAVDIVITGNRLSSTTASKYSVDENTPTDGLIFTNNSCELDASATYSLNLDSSTVNYNVGGNTFNGASIVTFVDSDTTPDVSGRGVNQFFTNTTGITITRFDNPYVGQVFSIISKGAIVYDTSSANRLIGSSVDITTASGDLTYWICETGGTTTSVCRLIGWTDVSADNS